MPSAGLASQQRVWVKRIFILNAHSAPRTNPGFLMSLTDKLASERRGRLAAERKLEIKLAELQAANRKNGLQAQALSEEIVETRAEVVTVRSENERVKSDLTVAQEKIQVAERRLWHSINSIQDGFAFFNNDDVLISANEAYLVVFDGLEEVAPGIPYARILQLLTDEGIVNPEGKSAAEWRAFMLGRRNMDSPEPVVIRLWNDQFIKMVDTRNPTGDLISLGLNITATVAHERELKSARKKAEEAARAKSAFLANMSHEIRTPMNGVVGMAELLADTGLNDEQTLYAETIRNSGEALLVIINDILDYSKIEAEKLVLMQSEFDFEKTIQEVLMLLQPAAREKNIALLLDYDMFLARRLLGDVGRVRQILTNLIGNAVKFTLEGHVLVRVSGVPDDHTAQTSIHVAIEDTGIGIPADKVDHIFAEFTQVDDERNRQFEGTGLGLAITQRLIKMMNGEVWVTSEEGVGSCFGFRIVLDRVDNEAPPPQQLPTALSKVMVVDDNEVNRDIIVRQLEYLGVAADGYAGGAAALDGLVDRYDLIITDHIMPNMSGADFVREVRARGVATPVILISSNISLLEDDEIRQEFSALLQRPVSRDTLITTLKNLGAQLEAGSAPDTDTEAEGAPSEDETPAAPMPVFRSRKRLSLEPPILGAPEVAGTPPRQDPDPVVTTETERFLPEVQNAPSEPVMQAKSEPAPPVEAATAPAEISPPVSQSSPEDIIPSVEVDGEPKNKTPEQALADGAAATVATPERHVSADALSAPKAEDSPPIPVGSETPAERMRVLAAEDNKTNQLVFKKMVKHLDIDLRFANNGLEAVEEHATFAPDLIFMDISMPHMDGKEATGAIRGTEAGTDTHVPIVALTAHAMTGDDDAILKAGLDHYLTKPLRKPAIEEMILRYVPAGSISPLPEQNDGN